MIRILYVIVQLEVFVAVGVCRIEARLAYNVGLRNFSLEVEGKFSINLIQRLTFTGRSSNARCRIADFWVRFLTDCKAYIW